MACPKTRKSGTGKNLAQLSSLASHKFHFNDSSLVSSAFDTRAGLPNSPGVSDLPWFVAHTKPRREKKLVEFCERQGFAATLPCYDSAHKYRGKTVVFRK